MADTKDLRRILQRIDGKGYKAYKDLRGVYNFPGGTLFIDHVQGDPFAAPSRLRFRVDAERAALPPSLFKTNVRRVALQDYLTRQFARNLEKQARGNRGSGKSGLIAIDRCGQEIIERTAMLVTSSFVEARFCIGLPARGRTVLGHQAMEMLCEEIPRIVDRVLLYRAMDEEQLQQHITVAEDQDVLRKKLDELGLIAFVRNGSILPRRSGVSDLPLPRDKAIPFHSPSELEMDVELPNAGKIRGMGIPEGVTLIVGGGYHGKSTLLRAVERGVYNHVPGDGREYVVAVATAVKIRAEDGRRVAAVNIDPFINNLPFKQDTTSFSSEEASGSTSQAANIMEYLEAGARLMLLDEDTSATNFMIRDVRMQALVAKEKEPITPFIDKVRFLGRDLGVSTVIVIGGSGDYFDVADTVIMMDEYRPYEVTGQAKKIASAYETRRISEGGERFGDLPQRVPLSQGLDPTKGKKVKIAAKGLHVIQYGRTTISLTAVEQLVDLSQTRAIGDMIYYLSRKYLDGRRSLREAVELVYQDVEREGLEVISPFQGENPGDYALPRPFELVAALNRIRTLRVKNATQEVFSSK